MPSKILNTLTLVPVGRYGSLGLIFDIIIDGKNLLDGIRDFESQYSKKIAGAYQSALGERDIASLHNLGSSFMPYACDCGEWECWFLTAKVSGYDNFIFWGDFSNPRRDDKGRASEGLYWSYKAFEMLCFDKQQYVDEIRKAQAYVNANAQ